jgi:hypothetical protein
MAWASSAWASQSHGQLLVAVAPRDLRGIGVPRALSHADQQLVGRELEVLVGQSVGDELAGRVGLRLREQREARPARLHDRVLHSGGRCAEGLEALPDTRLVVHGLLLVCAEQLRQPLVLGDLRRGLHLREGLLLDRMSVGQVLDDLVVQGLVGHQSTPCSSSRTSSSDSSIAAAARFSSRCPTEDVPGMGSMTGERCSSHASAS